MDDFNLTEKNDTIIEAASNATNTSLFCQLQWFHSSYIGLHGYLSLIVCMAGTIMNVLNIAVLSRKEMRSSTNLILTGIAIADLLVMVEYLPYTYLLHIKYTSGIERYTYSLSSFLLSHAIISQVFHTISIALTLILAIWRYVAIAYLQKVRSWHQISTTTKVVIATYIICPIICSPLYVLFSVKKITNGNATVYIVSYSDLASDIPSLKTWVHFWLYGALLKLLPCIILTMLSLRIVYALVKKKERRKHLMDSNQLLNNTKRPSVKKKQSDRTTKMLLTVLLLFLITEFPQAIMGFLLALKGDAFYKECYNPLAELLDMLALANAGINFVLYCCMSRQFRVTFSLLFKPKWLGTTKLANKDVTLVTQITQV